LLEALVEIAEFDDVFCDDACTTRDLGERDAARCRADPSIDEYGIAPRESRLLRNGFAQLHTSGIHACGRAVTAPLATGAARHGEARVTEAHDNPVDRNTHHLSGSLCDDGVAAGADVGHVGLDRHNPAPVDSDSRR
jgi:hypothetical protein